jgi:hypothetical protein
MKTLYALLVLLIAATFAEAASPSWSAFNTNSFIVNPTNPPGVGSIQDLGGGQAATNLSPWITDINGNGHSLTNARNISVSGVFSGNGSGLTNLVVPIGNSQAVLNMNPVLWADPTRLAIPDGSFLTSAQDYSGNGNTLQSVGESNVVWLSKGLGGSACFQMLANWNQVSGAAPTYGFALQNATMWLQSMFTNSSVTMVFQDKMELGGNASVPLLNGGQVPCLFSAGGNAQYFGNPFAATAGDTFGGIQTISSGVGVIAPLQLHNGMNVVTFRLTGASPDIWLNGLPVAYTNFTGASVPGGLGNQFTVGNLMFSGSIQTALGAYCGTIGDIVVTSNSPPDSQLRALHQYEMAKYSISGSGAGINFLGDSITVGEYASIRSNFTALTHQAFADNWVSCYAIVGAQSSQIDIAITNSGPSKVPGTGNQIDVLMWGVNDIHNNETLAFTATNTLNAITYLHSEGHKVILCTLPSFIWETGFTTTRAQLNTFFYSISNLVDGFADYASDPQMGTNGACVQQTTLFRPADQIHLILNAYNLLDQRWLFPQINLMKSSPNVNQSGSFSGLFNSTNGPGSTISLQIQTNSSGPHGYLMEFTNGLYIGNAPY